MFYFVVLSGSRLGRISVSGGQGAVQYASNSSAISVDESSGVVTLQQTLDYAVSTELH